MTTAEDRSAEWLIKTLAERKEPGGLYSRLKRWIGRAAAGLSALVIAMLAVVMVLSRCIGERHPGCGFLLYLPQQGWLLPFAFTLPLAALFRRRWFLAQLVAIALFAWLHMGFTWSLPRSAADQSRSLTILANNRGEDNKQSFTSFIQAENPDLLVLQDDGRADAFKRAYPALNAVSHGQFTLVSRFPILQSDLLHLPSDAGRPAAAWFEIDFHGTPVVIYNIHLPTPRSDLGELRGRGLIASFIGFGQNRLGRRRAEEQAKWTQRTQLARELEQAVARDQRPVIMAGDFNMPAWGHLHGFFSRFDDTFAARGRGFGFSFPGITRNPLTLFGPWLRIDYIFSSPAFRPLSAKVEPRRASQHRCVVARVELLPK